MPPIKKGTSMGPFWIKHAQALIYGRKNCASCMAASKSLEVPAMNI